MSDIQIYNVLEVTLHNLALKFNLRSVDLASVMAVIMTWDHAIWAEA